MILFIFLILMVPATIAGVVASILFDLALRYGRFGRTADGTPLRVRKLYLSNVPIGFVATYIAFLIATFIPRSEVSTTISSSILAVLIVLAIKFTSRRCAIRRARRATREPLDTDTHALMNAAPSAPAPDA